MTTIAKFAGSNHFIGSAKFSSGRIYRYWLLRSWEAGAGTLAVIGLNPSTADEERNDPTVTRCIRRAQRLGYQRLLMLNMFAWRGTDPRELWAAMDRGIDIVGGPAGFVVSLQEYCTRFEATKIIAAWGNLKRDQAVLSSLCFRGASWKLDCLKLNRDGSPAHPLYLPYNFDPQPWNYAP